MIEINREHRIELALDEEPALRYKTLRPGKRCRFTFDGMSLDAGHTVVAWFTDNGGFRWQVDEYTHLCPGR